MVIMFAEKLVGQTHSKEKVKGLIKEFIDLWGE